MKLNGKTAFITGSGKRIGRAIAEKLLLQGVNIAAHYRTSRAEVEELISRYGKDKVFGVQADLKNVAELQKAFEKAVQNFGSIEILINSASDFYPKPALQVTEADWDHFSSTNLKGQFFLAQAFAARLPKSQTGCLINLGDVCAEYPRKNFVAYLASKGGLLSMTKALALEWGPQIRVNSIAPGPVLKPEKYSETQAEKAAESTLMGRWGTADDIANAALFLLENDYITGLDLKVDGGRSLRE